MKSTVVEKRRNPQIFRLLVVVIVTTRVLSWLSNPSGVLHPDSSTYLPLQWGDFSKVSFLGNAQRSWVVPLLYALSPSNSARILVQLLIGACVWILVLRFVIQHCKDSSYQVPLLVILTLIGCSPSIVQFETAILATSTIIYLLLAYVMLSIHMLFQEKITLVQLSVFVLLGWLNLSVKGSNLIIVLPLLIFMIAKSKSRVEKWNMLAVTLVAATLVIQSGLMNWQNDKQLRYTYSSFTMLWHLGKQSPTSSGLTSYLSTRGAPECLTQDAPFEDVTKSLSRIHSECPAAKAYLESNFKKDVFTFLVRNPGDLLRNASTGLAIAFSSTASNYGTVVSVLPQPLANFVFGGVAPDFRMSGIDSQSALGTDLRDREPLWVFIPGLILALFPIAIRITNWRKTSVGHLLIALHFLLVAEMLLTITILPSEWFRQNAQYLISLYVLGVISFAVTGNENAEKSKA